MKKNPRMFGAVGPNIWEKKLRNFAQKRETPCKELKILGVMGPKMWKNVGNFASENAKFCENQGFLAQCREKNVHKCKASKIASLEGTSWEKRLHKHIVFWTTHEITYLNSGELICCR